MARVVSIITRFLCCRVGLRRYIYIIFRSEERAFIFPGRAQTEVRTLLRREPDSRFLQSLITSKEGSRLILLVQRTFKISRESRLLGMDQPLLKLAFLSSLIVLDIQFTFLTTLHLVLFWKYVLFIYS